MYFSFMSSIEEQCKFKFAFFYDNVIAISCILIWLIVTLSFRPMNRVEQQVVITQSSYGSCKTWKVMEFLISISRPGKSRNLCEGRGKSWKSNMLSEKKKAKR